MRELQIKNQTEEQKNLEKLRKQKANEESIENWIKRQAEAMEIQNRIKRMKEEIIKQELLEKQKREEIRKIQADEAFRTWAKKKPSLKLITQDTNANKENNIKRSHYLNRSKPKIIIGPYTNAKELKEIQKKINMYHESAYTNELENKRDSYEDDDNSNEKEETNKKIEDSLQELSSIKRDTPEHEDY